MMRFTGEPQHVGIYTGDTLIHAYESVGKVVEHRMDDKWLRRIVRVYRFKDMA
jgi:cell wall-associated NlpC family hydrolase